MTFYFSVNPDPVNFLKGYFVLYWLLTFAGLLIIGTGLYHHWRYRLSYFHWASNFVGIVIIVLAYGTSWGYFYVLTVKDRKIYLQYFFPRRTKEFSIREVKSFDRRYFGKSRLCHFLIETRNGRVYTSAAIKDEALNLNEEKLKKYMQSQLGYIKPKSR